MKTIQVKTGLVSGLISCSLFASFLLFPCTNMAQEKVQYKEKAINVTKQKTNEMDETTLRKMMKADGVSDPVIDKLIEQRKTWLQQGKNVNWTSVKSTPPITHAPCTDMGVENGWSAWLGDVGTANNGSQTWTPPPGPPTAPNFSITSGPSIDANTPNASFPNTTIPVVCPGFGSQSIMIGEPCMYNCVAEQLTYALTVTPNDTNFVYAYAIVIEDAGHSPTEQPFVELCIYDQFGNQVPCGCFRYTGGQNIPGFYYVNGNGCGWSGADQYKPWTLVGVNLSPYIGQTLNVVITNVDCSQCGHWAYSYWDFLCGTASISAGCIGNQSTICGPIDPNIQYTYQWYQNGTPIPPPTGTQQCIVVTPQPNDTFSVQVSQPSGCGFFLGYVPSVVQPGFSYTGACGTFTFIDTSVVTPSGSVTTGWNWSFPGGSPSSATTPTATVTYSSPGQYAVTLTVTISAGCYATATQTINVTALPQAAFNSSPACLGNAVTLNDGSISPVGDPIVSWSWSMPGGTPATATGTNASTVYTTAGPHTVTLTVTTQQGCTSSTYSVVTVYNPPVANFTGNNSGCAPICVDYYDASTTADGNIINWNWTFPGGNPATSSTNTVQVCYLTPGSYGATLIVTTSYGCKDTITITPTAIPYPWPDAGFNIISSNPASAADPTFAFSDLWSSDVVQWTWYFGDGDSNMVDTDPVHSYSATVTGNDFYSFTVCLRVLNQYGCWDTICERVELIPEFTFYMPNTFSPNNDLFNELFFGKGRGIKSYNIWLFDRWGNLLWECDYSGSNVSWDEQGQDGMSSYCKWDGKVVQGGADMSGSSKQPVQEDVYVWKVKLTDVFDRKHTYVGHVNVIR